MSEELAAAQTTIAELEKVLKNAKINASFAQENANRLGVERDAAQTTIANLNTDLHAAEMERTLARNELHGTLTELERENAKLRTAAELRHDAVDKALEERDAAVERAEQAEKDTARLDLLNQRVLEIHLTMDAVIHIGYEENVRTKIDEFFNPLTPPV